MYCTELRRIAAYNEISRIDAAKDKEFMPRRERVSHLENANYVLSTHEARQICRLEKGGNHLTVLTARQQFTGQNSEQKKQGAPQKGKS